MRSTRQSILQIIQRRGSETVGGLAKELGLASATVRRHLDILQRDGLVVFAEVRKGTGRPEHSFTLTEAGHESLPKGYGVLLGGLVGELARTRADEIAGKSGAEALEGALTRLGQAVGRRYVNPGSGEAAAAVLEALRDGNFDPEVRHDPDRTRISLGNCPFRSVALSDDAICSYDAAILESILGTTVVRERCITGGHESCVYTTYTTRSESLQAVAAAPPASPPVIVDDLGGERLG
jgi:predicted ArsR family transcriptional regulator